MSPAHRPAPHVSDGQKNGSKGQEVHTDGQDRCELIRARTSESLPFLKLQSRGSSPPPPTKTLVGSHGEEPRGVGVAPIACLLACVLRQSWKPVG